jgi:hypothetical protein
MDRRTDGQANRQTQSEYHSKRKTKEEQTDQKNVTPKERQKMDRWTNEKTDRQKRKTEKEKNLRQNPKQFYEHVCLMFFLIREPK